VPEPTLTVSVDAPPAVTEAGLKLAVAPAGRPLALRLTVCALPLSTAVLIVAVPLLPWAIVTLAGLAEIEKSDGGAGLTVRLTVVECVAVEPVPVTVIVYVAGVVAAATEAVIVDDAPAATDAGLNEIVTPAGWPLALRLTLCAAPLSTAVPIVDVPL
jgi:hypothetical protein